jgi:hypothetical protein
MSKTENTVSSLTGKVSRREFIKVSGVTAAATVVGSQAGAVDEIGFDGYMTAELAGGDEAYLADVAKRMDTIINMQ